jgi:hypothetical protein
MHGLRHGVALPTVSSEDEAPLDVTAPGTHEGVVLEARDHHRVVLNYLHQDHLCPARHTIHRTYSPTNGDPSSGHCPRLSAACIKNV